METPSVSDAFSYWEDHKDRQLQNFAPVENITNAAHLFHAQEALGTKYLYKQFLYTCGGTSSPKLSLLHRTYMVMEEIV